MVKNLIRRAAVTGTLALLGAVVPGIAASAAPAAHAARAGHASEAQVAVQDVAHLKSVIDDFSNATICSFTDLCWTADGTSGDAVFGKGYAGGTNQMLGVSGAFVCSNGTSDHVQTGCPFSVASLNTFYSGKEIVTVQRANSPAYCLVGGITTTDLYQKTCGSTNYLWVLDGALSSPSGATMVNVGRSNGQGGDGSIACTNAVDNPMSIYPYAGNAGASACLHKTHI